MERNELATNYMVLTLSLFLRQHWQFSFPGEACIHQDDDVIIKTRDLQPRSNDIQEVIQFFSHVSSPGNEWKLWCTFSSVEPSQITDLRTAPAHRTSLKLFHY